MKWMYLIYILAVIFAGLITVYGADSLFGGNIVPSVNNTYDLGNTTNMWRNLTAVYLRGALACNWIYGGSDTDFCADATGGGGGSGVNYWQVSGAWMFPNESAEAGGQANINVSRINVTTVNVSAQMCIEGICSFVWRAYNLTYEQMYNVTYELTYNTSYEYWNNGTLSQRYNVSYEYWTNGTLSQTINSSYEYWSNATLSKFYNLTYESIYNTSYQYWTNATLSQNINASYEYWTNATLSQNYNASYNYWTNASLAQIKFPIQQYNTSYQYWTNSTLSTLNRFWSGLLGYDNLTKCSANQIIKMDGTGTSWTCAADATGEAGTSYNESYEYWSNGTLSIRYNSSYEYWTNSSLSSLNIRWSGLLGWGNISNPVIYNTSYEYWSNATNSIMYNVSYALTTGIRNTSYEYWTNATLSQMYNSSYALTTGIRNSSYEYWTNATLSQNYNSSYIVSGGLWANTTYMNTTRIYVNNVTCYTQNCAVNTTWNGTCILNYVGTTRSEVCY